jgi:hypothetical protein
MGTSLSMTDELSFQDQLLTILDVEDTYTEKAREVEKENNGPSTGITTHTDFQGTPDDPYQVRLHITQTEPHRPQLKGITVERLNQAVTDEKPAVPVDKLSFDNRLSIILDAAERYYEALYCEIN